MAAHVGKTVIKPMVRALDDMPVHVRRLAQKFRGQGKRQKDNKDEVNQVDRYDDGVVTSRGGNTKATEYDPNTGRPISERGTITEDFGSSARGDNATAVGNGEGSLRTDDGGHLGAHRFFGDTPDEGIVPQDSNLNRGAWKKMENEWADWVASGRTVDYDIKVQPPGSLRPDSFDVSYTVTDPVAGEIYRVTENFSNAAGQVFDRVPRSLM